MQPTGIVRRLDTLGRIVLPIEIRRKYEIEDGTPLEVFCGEDGEIILRKYAPFCTFCGSPKFLVNYRGKMVCQKCAKDLRGIAS